MEISFGEAASEKHYEHSMELEQKVKLLLFSDVTTTTTIHKQSQKNNSNNFRARFVYWRRW